MYVDLTENEVRELIHVMEERLRELRSEIHLTDHEYKAMLVDHQRVLQCLHDKLVTEHCMSA